jgi:hypothetical protein
VDTHLQDPVYGGLGPAVQIVAAQDNTHVTFRPTVNVPGAGSVAGTPKGVPQSYALSKGQTLQLMPIPGELGGSAVQSDKPIGLWASMYAMGIDGSAIDTAHQQIPPVRALGREYVGVRYRNRVDGREESPPWRIVGAVDGTTLTYDPSPPVGAPLTISSGSIAEFRTATPFVVSSQDSAHPFYLAAYMTGGGDYGGAGDPEFVNVIAPQQFRDSYVFFTDPTYPETNLIVVRAKASDSTFKDVTLDCAGALGGWQPVGTSGTYEYTRIDLVRHDFAPQGGCDNGKHEIHSSGPFGVTVWGWGTAETGGAFGDPSAPGFYSQYVSYAYPAGLSLQPINDVVVPAAPR